MNPSSTSVHSPACQSGFSLMELMIAITLSLLIVIALAAMFVSSSRARTELEAANQQIENGRYAIQVLKDDLELAGYLSQFNIANAPITLPAAKPDPCLATIAALNSAFPVYVQGYSDGTALTCLAGQGVIPNTGVVVIRRASTCVRGATDCPAIANAPYFQSSLCADSNELLSSAVPSLTTPYLNDQYRLNTVESGGLTMHNRNCTTAADMRQFIVHIYFLADHSQTGDGIPTLKRADLGNAANPGGFTVVPIADGIQNLQFEYGIDTDSDGTPEAYTATPDTANGCAGATAACSPVNWTDIVSAKIYLLARNTAASSDFTDSKSYAMGPVGTLGPFNDAFKRHAYQAVVRLTNPAGRRER